MELHFFPWPKKFLLGLLCVSVLALGCENDNDDDDDDNTASVSTTANGAQEVPVVTTPATGTLTGTYDMNTRMLSYNVTWNNLKDSATMAHFHGPAPAGQNAGVLITIFNDRRGTSGSATGSTTVADTTWAHFQNGRIYLNIHSKAHGGGEIRGQVTVQ